MIGIGGGRSARWGLLAIALFVSSGAIAPNARALEALEGRVQLHGFVETQVRGLSSRYSDEFDLAQWYNVLNLELELDILPDGWGPMDLLEAYVRVEARYDCVWTRGCGTMRSANTYGDRAKRLPGRLRGAQDPDYSGVIPPTEPIDAVKRIQDKRPAPFAPLTITDTNGIFGNNENGVVTTTKRQGLPGFDTLFELKGADNVLGTEDDPAIYTNSPVLDYKFALLNNNKGAPGSTGQTQISGPWNPKSFIEPNALLIDKANPFRGSVAAMGLFRTGVDSAGYRGGMDPLDPRLAVLKAELFDAADQGITLGTATPPLSPLNAVSLLTTVTPGDITGDSFAGDYSGIIPCENPTSPEATAVINGTEYPSNCYPNLPRDPITGEVSADGVIVPENGLNLAIIGGAAELPMRPAPDLSNLTSLDAGTLLFGDEKDKTAAAQRLALGFSGNNAKRLYAQGLYVPSPGLRRELAKGIDPVTGVPELDSKGLARGRGRLDNVDFNYRQAERAWNRGQSQQDTKELKEAYLDIEWLESRLWTRVGLQNIVWGKTELFRTTDQFNPQDLALASLPSLEESRIALWAARFVYSLYDVGPMEDVRVEFAFNFDNYQPADLGAAGDPFTPDLVGLATAGIMFHSITGIGVAGVDRPENPWDSIKGLEVGGRIEWRWDRFSFALTDFYGYSDFPYIDRIFTYDRTVAVGSGRPLIAEVSATSECDTPSAGGYVNQGEAGGQPTTIDTAGTAPERPFDDPKNPFSASPFGIGTNPNCLKGGGAPGFENENLAGGAQNALYFSPANQQLFAWICSSTIAIGSALDPGSCAFNIFGSNAQLIETGGTAEFAPFLEIMTAIYAGEPGTRLQTFLNVITSATKEKAQGENDRTEFVNASLRYPLAPLNLDFGPDGPDTQSTGWDGVITASHPLINSQNLDAQPFVIFVQDFFGSPASFPVVGAPDCDSELSGNRGPETWNPTATFFGLTVEGGVCKQFRFHYDELDMLTADSTMTNAQRALIGCGPFYGTRCDSGDEVFVLPQGTYATFNDAVLAKRQLFNEGGGIDFLNTEASILVQSWPGVEGTAPIGDAVNQGIFWTTMGQAAQPGTVDFDGGPTCTRPVGSGDDFRLETLPGCRGISSIDPLAVGTAAERVEVTFDAEYLPSLDGCIVSSDIGGVPVIFPGVVPGSRLDQELDACASASKHKTGGFVSTIPVEVVDGAGTIFHPLAGCLPDTEEQRVALGFPEGTVLAKNASVQDDCAWFERDYETEFLGIDPSGRTAQVFRSEMAAFSFNFMTFLVVSSCDPKTGDDIAGDQECFNPNTPAQADKCSFNAPHLCTNVKGFLSIAGVGRDTLNAGGNGRFGRRTFAWHGGGEVVLRYEKRNVLGFSMDFAEDVTKSNWSMELTWIEGSPYVDNNAHDNITKSDAYNLTVSVDRPTFINFLNPNRTFFFNSQWFFQYLPDHEGSFTNNGPVNVLFTLAAFTGYFQDRLLPTFVSVFDINSQSGGLLPSVSYRFTEAFSATIGMNWFFGRTQRVKMPLNEIAPPGNRAPDKNGNHAYQDGTDNLLSLIRHRDEAYIRLRWTF